MKKQLLLLRQDKKKKINYTVSKATINKNKVREITYYDQAGNIKSVDSIYYKTQNLEIYKSEDGNIEETHYNENNHKTYIKWTYPNGAIDEKFYNYKDEKLVEIIEKDPFDTYRETLNYYDGKLDEILSLDEDGSIIMRRKFIYNENGTIAEVQRIQDDEINKSILYTYNETSQLILQEESKINRFTGAIMPPERREYIYHKNGILNEETWTIYFDRDYTKLADQYITQYNEMGLKTKEITKDFRDGSEQIYEYRYSMK